MKTIIVLIIAAFFISDIDRIALINSLKSEAKEAYQSGDYKTAIEKYKYLVDSLNVNEEEVSMNLANAYFQANDSVNASNQYRSLVQSKSPKMRSLSNQQLGVLSNRTGKYEEALAYFKQSLRSDPTNEDARYNYEMVKKKLEEQKKQEEQNKDKNKDDQQKQDQEKKDSKDQQENKDQKKDEQGKEDKEKKEKQDQQNKEKQDQEKKDKEKSDQQKEEEQNEENKEKKDIPPSVSDKLKQMEMSEEKAKMILEAMKNQEIQYLQQNKRKATKPKDKSKPDW